MLISFRIIMWGALAGKTFRQAPPQTELAARASVPGCAGRHTVRDPRPSSLLQQHNRRVDDGLPMRIPCSPWFGLRYPPAVVLFATLPGDEK
jgi:hypothetical protein